MRRGERDDHGDRSAATAAAAAGGAARVRGLGECVEAPGPAGSVLCRKASASLSGRTGCQRKAFRVQVRGRQIAKVIFTVDGAKLATLRAPNRGNRFSVMLVRATSRSAVIASMRGSLSRGRAVHEHGRWAWS